MVYWGDIHEIRAFLKKCLCRIPTPILMKILTTALVADTRPQTELPSRNFESVKEIYSPTCFLAVNSEFIWKCCQTGNLLS
jgi:hypothetical protein